MNTFAGRRKEVNQILDTFNPRKGTLNVIRGRRRIGKTRLIKELPNHSKKVTLRYLTSLPPSPELTDQIEREQYAEQVKREFKLTYTPPHDSWRALFSFIGDQCRDKHTILALDEINWCATKSPAFMSMFFELWENEYSQKQNFIVILSGSLSSWIEENILMNKGFVGRISVTLTLNELKLSDMKAFFGAKLQRTPKLEIIKLIGALGAIPRYLEEIQLKHSAEANLERIALSEGGLLYEEFERMFYDLFSKENKFFRDILKVIGVSKTLMTPKEIAEKMKLTYSGRHSQALDILCEVGFLKKQYYWNISSKKKSNYFVLRPSDNYTLFYFRYILPLKEARQMGGAGNKNLPNILGLQFENLVHNNVEYILDKIGIKSKDVLFAGGYYQTANKRRQGCQIDLMIQTKNRVYVCECKLYSGEVPRNIVNEIQSKIDKLVAARGVSFHPVLIHANMVNKSVEDNDYFDHIIDMQDAL